MATRLMLLPTCNSCWKKEEELEKPRLLDLQRAHVGRTVGLDSWWFSIMCLG